MPEGWNGAADGLKSLNELTLLATKGLLLPPPLAAAANGLVYCGVVVAALGYCCC